MLRGKWGMWQLEYAQCTWTWGLRELHFGCYQKVLYLHWAIGIVLSPFLHCAICTAQSERECALCNARRRVHHCTEEGTGAGAGAPSCGKWAIMCIWQYLGNPFTLLPRVARSQDWRAPEISLKDIFCEKGFFVGDRGVDGLEGDAWQCSELSHLLAGFDTRWYQLDLRHLKFTCAIHLADHWPNCQ